jgi:hypothetical protein
VAQAQTTLTLSSGAGPYALPTDYLRSSKDDVFYTILGVPYSLVAVEQSEYDALVQTPGTASYPYCYMVTFENQDTLGYPQMYVWPPSSGSYPLTVNYQAQPPDITTPETSPATPWFPDQNYLITRLAGELMKVTDDDRSSKFLGDGPDGAQGILRRYLKLKEEGETVQKRVTLDRRFFGNGGGRLSNTKTIGW